MAPGPAIRFTPLRAAAVLCALLAAAAVAFLVAARYGEQPISLWAAFTQPESFDATILWLRFRRALLAGIVGAALAASGSTLQSLLRNPLADPFILGVSGGAAVGATLAFALGAGALASVGFLGGLARVAGPSLFAFLGSLGAMPDQRLLVPASALAGAAFLMLSDLVARLLFVAFPQEQPVGVVTAVLGGPFFLFLLRRSDEIVES